MLVLAQNCGLSTAQSKIIQADGRDVLLVRRFDREKTARGYLRSRMMSSCLFFFTDTDSPAPTCVFTVF